MVEISISEDEVHLEFSASGPRFTEIIESFKYSGLRYNHKNKKWIGPIGLYEKYLECFDEYGTSQDEYTKEFIQRWKQSSQLIKITKRSEFRKYIPELMKVLPIVPN